MLRSDRIVRAVAGAVVGSLVLGGGLLLAMDSDPVSPAAAGASRKAEGNSVSAFDLGGEAGTVPGLGPDVPGTLGVAPGGEGSSVSAGGTGTGPGPVKGQGPFVTAGADPGKGVTGVGGAGTGGTGGPGGKVGTGGGAGSGGGSANGDGQVTPPASPNAPAAPKPPNVVVPQSVSREGSFTAVVPLTAGQTYKLCLSGDVDGDGDARCERVEVPGVKGATLTLAYSGNASALPPRFTPGPCGGGSTITVIGLTPGARVDATARSSPGPSKTVSAGARGKDASLTASLCKA